MREGEVEGKRIISIVSKICVRFINFCFYFEDVYVVSGGKSLNEIDRILGGSDSFIF